MLSTVLSALLGLALLALACLITLIVLMGWQSAPLILQFFGLFALAPLLLGLGSSMLLYRRRQR